MKILSATQSREADQFTIENEPIPSIDLMERAVAGLYEAITSRYDTESRFEIYCGKGNNGGDGLGLARELAKNEFEVHVVVVEHSENASTDFLANLGRLKNTSAKISHLDENSDLTGPEENVIVIDAILGSGLTRPLEGLIAEVVSSINKSGNYKIAIDIPTGLFADSNADNDLDKVMKVDWCLTIQQPKLSMLHKDTAGFIEEFTVIDIGLHRDYINSVKTHLHYVNQEDIHEIYKPRHKHSYKGTYGHAFLLAGSKGTSGAAILAAKAALRSGAGLVTVCTSGSGLIPLQSHVPEAMVMPDANEDHISELPDLHRATALGIGPGIGKGEETAKVLKQLIQTAGLPMVMDADALNILGENRTWISFLPLNTILTPHPGEFKRLLGTDELGDDYLDVLREFSMKNKVIVILKDSISVVAEPLGNLFFLNEGSPALASAGSGDVLTGIITALLAGGYRPLEAALLGVYLQSRAGYVSGKIHSEEASIASDVIDCLSVVFNELHG